MFLSNIPLYCTDERLKKLASERNELTDELRHLKLELEEERARGSRAANPGDLADLQSMFNLFFSFLFKTFQITFNYVVVGKNTRRSKVLHHPNILFFY